MIGSQCLRSHSDGRPISWGAFGKRDRGEPPFSVAANLGDRQVGIRKVRDPEWHDSFGIGNVPGLVQPVVPRADAGHPEIAVFCHEEDPPAEAGDLGREVDRGPDAVQVHVADSSVDVVATRPHLVETEGLEAESLGPPAGDRVHAHLRVVVPFELPDLVALGCLDYPRRPVGQAGGHSALEGVDGLDDMIVDRDDGCPHLAWLGVGQEQVRVVVRARRPPHRHRASAKKGSDS